MSGKLTNAGAEFFLSGAAVIREDCQSFFGLTDDDMRVIDSVLTDKMRGLNLQPAEAVLAKIVESRMATIAAAMVRDEG